MSALPLCWPECFSQNVTDFLDEPIESVLATQLCAWGNVYMGVMIPSNFFEVMDAASKVTQAFTPQACKDRYEVLMSERRNGRTNFNQDYDNDEE